MTSRAADPRNGSRRLLVATVISLSMAGCIAPKSYVDPTFPKVSYADFQPKVQKKPIYLGVQFQTQGTSNPRATSLARNRTKTILLASQLFSEVVEAGAGDMDRLDIVMNNVGDRGAAAAKGFGTGLTFGLVGSMVTDEYIFTAIFTPVGKDPIKKEYRHAIHTTIGNKAGPEGLEPVSVQEAFDKVLEQLVLKLLLDLRLGEHL